MLAPSSIPSSCAASPAGDYHPGLDLGETGALTSLAFETGLPGFGNYVVAIALAIFAFTTIGWSFYGEHRQFLFGVKAIVPYRVLWIIAIPVSATVNPLYLAGRRYPERRWRCLT